MLAATPLAPLARSGIGLRCYRAMRIGVSLSPLILVHLSLLAIPFLEWSWWYVLWIVAIISAKWADIDSLETLLGFEETAYFALFFWLAITGAGKASLDYLISRI